MANEALKETIKSILTLGKAGKLEEAYTAYGKLFADPTFVQHRPEDQRQVLKLMVLAKGQPKPPTAIMVEAHRAALGPLTELVSTANEAVDYEMLGVCHVVLGNLEAASRIFRQGLVIERARDASSTLCGQLMKRVSDL